MSQLLLPSLEIKGFRGFQHLRIENLQRVNLIVGKNSVGKISLLEAWWLYARDWNKYVESGILRERNEKRQAHYDPKELDYNNSVRHLFFNRPTLSSNNPLEISIGSVESPMTFSIDTGARNGTPRAHIIIPVGGLSPHEIEQAWDAIALAERQDYLLEALTQLCASPGMSVYLWNTGATKQCLTVNTAGTFTVTVRDFNGSTSSCTEQVTLSALPTCGIKGFDPICPGTSTIWCAPSSASAFLWNTGATTQCLTVVQPGTYTVTTTNSDGCTNVCSKILSNFPPITCVITGSTSICQGYLTQLCAPPGMSSYFWSTGATTQCITVGAGNYTVTITDGNGCYSSCATDVALVPNPVCSVSGNNSICTGSSTQWCAAAPPAGSSFTYSWSTGETTQCVSVDSIGTYIVIVTDQFGCTSSCSKSLSNYPTPTCTITENNFCAGEAGV